MGYTPQQIGWSQESILLQRIIKQLVAINKAFGGVVATTTTTTTV